MLNNLQGHGYKVQKSPAIRYIGPNFGDFFLKGSRLHNESMIRAIAEQIEKFQKKV